MAEMDLLDAAGETAKLVNARIREGNYVAALKEIATLRPHVDRFFEEVMVFDPNPNVRRTRINMLATIVGDFRRIADLSEIVTAG
jgi:glycyl-tRNA synthetase beta chain